MAPGIAISDRDSDVFGRQPNTCWTQFVAIGFPPLGPRPERMWRWPRRPNLLCFGFVSEKEGLVQVQVASFGLLDLFLHGKEAFRAHVLLRQRVAVEQSLDVVMIGA